MKLIIQDLKQNSYQLEIEGTPETITLKAVVDAIQSKDKSLDTIVLNGTVIYESSKQDVQSKTLKSLGIQDEGNAVLVVYNNYDYLFTHCNGGFRDTFEVDESCYFSRDLFQDGSDILSRFQINPPKYKRHRLSHNYGDLFILKDGNVLIEYYNSLLEVRDAESNLISKLDITQVKFPRNYDKYHPRFSLTIKLWPISDSYFFLKVTYAYEEGRPFLPCYRLFVLQYANAKLSLVQYSGYNFDKNQSEELFSSSPRLYSYLKDYPYSNERGIDGLYRKYMGDNYVAYRDGMSPDFIDLIYFNSADHRFILEGRIKLQEIVPMHIARFNDGNFVIVQNRDSKKHFNSSYKKAWMPPKIQVYNRVQDEKASFKLDLEHSISDNDLYLKKILPKLNMIILEVRINCKRSYNILSTNQIKFGKDKRKNFIERPLKMEGKYIVKINSDGLIISRDEGGVVHVDKITEDDMLHDALKGLLIPDLVNIVCDYLRPRQTVFPPISQAGFFGMASFCNPLDAKSETLCTDILGILAPLNNTKTYYLSEKIGYKLNSLSSSEPLQFQEKIKNIKQFILTLKSDPLNKNHVTKLDDVIVRLDNYAKSRHSKSLTLK